MASELYTWGWGKDGQLGHGDRVSQKTPVRVEFLQNKGLGEISCGGWHTASLTGDGTMLTWGSGRCGQLGHGDWSSQRLPTLVNNLSGKGVSQVASGSFHTVVLCSNGEVYSWGCGRDGQLGHGDWGSPRVPHLVKALQGKNVIQVSCGEYHSAALTASGEVFTWGDGGDGQLGHGDWRSKGYRLSQPRLVKSLQGKGVVQISCGEYHTAALGSNGDVYTWGKSVNGQLGHSEDSAKKTTSPTLVESIQGQQVARIACGGAHTVALTANGDVWQWGDPISGQLGLVSSGAVRFPSVVEELSGKGIVSVECGSFHTAAISSAGELYTWGHGGEGRLGHGDESNQAKPKLVRALAGKPVTQVACGRFHTAACTGASGPSLAVPTLTAPQANTSSPRLDDAPLSARSGTSSGPASARRGSQSRSRPGNDSARGPSPADYGIPPEIRAGMDADDERAAMMAAAQADAINRGPAGDQLVYGRPIGVGELEAKLAAMEAELQQAYADRDRAMAGGAPGTDRERLVAQAEQERESHSAQVAELELSLARKKAECEVFLAERNKLQEEVDKWRKEKEALDMALKNVTDNFAATSASMAEGHRQRENDLEDRLKEAIDSATKGNPKALREMNELRKQLEFTTQELEKERLAREAAEKTCRDLRKELMSAKEEVDRMWEELNTNRETHGKIVRDLEEQLSRAIEEKDTAMERATKAQEERLRHFEELIMEKARQEREDLSRAHMELEQQLAHAIAEKNTLEKQTGHLITD